MSPETHLYIARAAVGIAILLLVWLCAYRLERIEANPPALHELRARHVLPVLGLGVTGIVLAAFALAILPR